MTIHCNAIGNPVPSIAWIRARSRTILTYNKALVFWSITAVSLADMSALLGMELETTAPTLVQLMYSVSACRITYFTSVRFM